MKKMFDENLVMLRLVKMKFDYSEKEINGNNADIKKILISNKFA